MCLPHPLLEIYACLWWGMLNDYDPLATSVIAWITWFHQCALSSTSCGLALLKASITLPSSRHSLTFTAHLNTSLWVPRCVGSWCVDTSLGKTHISNSNSLSPPWAHSTHCAHVAWHILNTANHTMGELPHVWAKTPKHPKMPHILWWEIHHSLHLDVIQGVRGHSTMTPNILPDW